YYCNLLNVFFFSSRRRHTRSKRDWSSDVCSSDLASTLAYRNVEQLFRACAKNNILILGAFPNPESDVLTLFEHRYLIEKERHSRSEERRVGKECRSGVGTARYTTHMHREEDIEAE